MIRPLVKADIAACAKVFVNTYNSAPWNYHWALEQAEQYLDEYASSAQFVGFVLHHNDEIAGAVLAHTKTWWTNSQLFIDELFISPDKQKMGCGKKLLLHTEQYAIDNSLETITLMTNKFMPAMEFYEKNDFMHAIPFVFLFKQV